MKKKKIKVNTSLTIKQQKMLNGILANLGSEQTKSLGQIAKEAGYTPAMQKNPKEILKSPALQYELNKYIEKLREKSQKALNAINDKKLAVSTAKDLTYITTTLSKHEQLLSGNPTDRVDGNLSLIELYEKANENND